MKCTNCGYEPEGTALYCAKCGAALPAEPAPATEPANEPVGQGFTPAEPAPATEPAPAAEPQTVIPPNAPIADPKSNSLLAAFKDALFLLICIFITASAGFSLLSGGLPLIEILLAVFLWITLYKASKNVLSVEHLRCVSGTVYANYVVTNVASVMLIVSGLIFGLCFTVMSGVPEFNSSFQEGFQAGILESLPQLEPFFSYLSLTVLGVVLGVIFLFTGAIMLVINVLGLRKIHRFTKSVYQGVGNPFFPFEDPHSAKTWLLVFGIFGGISALSSLGSGLFPFLSAVCSAIPAILATLLIDKYVLK